MVRLGIERVSRTVTAQGCWPAAGEKSPQADVGGRGGEHWQQQLCLPKKKRTSRPAWKNIQKAILKEPLMYMHESPLDTLSQSFTTITVRKVFPNSKPSLLCYKIGRMKKKSAASRHRAHRKEFWYLLTYQKRYSVVIFLFVCFL